MKKKKRKEKIYVCIYGGTLTYENPIIRKILNSKRALKKFPSRLTKKIFKIRKLKVPPDIRMCEIDIGNPKYTTFTKLVQVRNFITFVLKVIRHEERETQSFYADCFYICPKPRAVSHLQTTGLASAGLESQPSCSDAGTQLTAFLKSLKSSALSGMTSFTSPGRISYLGIFILTSVKDTFSPHARGQLR